MEFGKVDAAELDHIDFALPPDSPENKKGTEHFNRGTKDAY